MPTATRARRDDGRFASAAFVAVRDSLNRARVCACDECVDGWITTATPLEPATAARTPRTPRRRAAGVAPTPTPARAAADLAAVQTGGDMPLYEGGVTLALARRSVIAMAQSLAERLNGTATAWQDYLNDDARALLAGTDSP